MKYNKLGNSDLLVSEVCLGTMTFGEQNTEDEAHAILSTAVELGVNFIDTAELYPVPSKPETQGRTEEYIGTWLAKGTVPREKVIIATKIVGYDTKSTFIPANRTSPKSEPTPCRLDAKSIRAACLGSLRRLQTDYIDLYQLHWPDRYTPNFGKTVFDLSKSNERDEKDPAVPFEETVQALGELIKEKKIRYWGVCNETSFGVAELVHACRRLGVPPPVSIQNCYNLTFRTFETELAETCSPSHYNLGLLPWSPLAGGALTGKYLEKRPDGSRSTLFPEFQTRFFKKPAVDRAIQGYVDIAKRFNITPAQLALAWCKSRWFIPATIIGATRLDQLRDNVKAFDIVLPQEAIDAVNEIHRSHPNPVLED